MYDWPRVDVQLALVVDRLNFYLWQNDEAKPARPAYLKCSQYYLRLPQINVGKAGARERLRHDLHPLLRSCATSFSIAYSKTTLNVTPLILF